MNRLHTNNFFLKNGRRCVNLSCDKCGKIFYRQLRLIKKNINKNTCKSCVSSVMGKTRKREIKTRRVNNCPDCGKKILLTSSKCKSCAQKIKRPNCIDCGIKIKLHSKRCLPCHNKNQDMGISRERTKFNNSDEWSNVRNSCFKRDSFLCQICFNGGVFLNAHHIFPYAKYPEHRLNINNLITLCVGCHRFVHSVLSMKKSA